MKNTLPLIFLALLAIHCNTSQRERVDYVEIKHIGVEQKTINLLFISDKQVNLEINGDSVKINNQKPDILTIRDKIILSEGYYSVLIIDSRTFQKIITFVDQHQDFFTNGGKKPHHDIDYSIIVKGKGHDISYKQKNQFFSGLINFLKAENCNKTSIASLHSYFYNYFYL